MHEALVAVGACAHVCVHHPTARRSQEQARAVGIGTLVPVLLAEGIDDLIIESRGPIEDSRDRGTILGLLQEAEGTGAFQYRWETKAEPLLWVADAVCGAVGEAVTKTNEEHLRRMVGSGVIKSLLMRP